MWPKTTSLIFSGIFVFYIIIYAGITWYSAQHRSQGPSALAANFAEERRRKWRNPFWLIGISIYWMAILLMPLSVIAMGVYGILSPGTINDDILLLMPLFWIVVKMTLPPFVIAGNCLFFSSPSDVISWSENRFLAWFQTSVLMPILLSASFVLLLPFGILPLVNYAFSDRTPLSVSAVVKEEIPTHRRSRKDFILNIKELDTDVRFAVSPSTWNNFHEGDTMHFDMYRGALGRYFIMGLLEARHDPQEAK